VTTWGPRVFEPLNAEFWRAVRDVRPDLYKGFNPWDRISDPDGVRALLVGAGAETVEAVAESGTHELARPEDWWSMVLGTGYRSTIEQLAPDAAERVRHDNLEFVRASGVRAVEVNVVYAVARKSPTEELAGKA
jgi:hypothetical protein